jgi:hypothetical protein
MNPSSSEQEPAKPVDVAPSSPSFPRRIFRRIRYMSFGTFLAGAAIGGAIDGFVGAVAWAIVLGLFGVVIGLIIGAYAWILETPFKGLIRGGGLMAATMSLPLFVLMLANKGWGGLGNAVSVALMTAGMGAVVGGILGAFLGWLAGPIFREMVQKMDRGESPFQSGR